MKITLVLLASGFGRRFGSNKLTALLYGRPLYTYGMESLCRAAQAFLPSSGIDCQAVLVTGHKAIAAACESQNIPVIWNDQAREGMAASLRAAVTACGNADAWAFFPADQPLLRAATIADFLRHFLASGAAVGCMHNGERRCSPAIFRSSYKEQLLALHGDRGGRQFLRGKDTCVYRSAAQEELFDIDTERDFVILDKITEEQL